jgi:hypothetical protein
VRGRHVVYLRRITPISLMGRPGRVVYAPTDVGPLWYSRLVSVPALFCRLPRSTQNRIAARSVRPACSHFVRVRLGEVKLSLGVEVRSAESAGDGLRVELSDGTEREIDHLMFGTGYRVDVARYGFMSDEILGDLRRVGDYPVLRRGLESSVEGLHIVGAPAAWSFGPIMRFVSGSWYAGKAVARVIGESRSPQPSLHVARVQPA